MDEADFTGFEPFELTDIKLTENRLGHGSYATVQEVEYMGLKCAGKKIHELLLEQGGRSSYTIHRFKEECRLLSQVRHPNIVQFLGVYFEQRVHAPILVMEFLPTNLTACIDEHFKFPKEIRYSILHDVALGLCYLHSQLPPIIHRDLSSNNVLLTPDVKAKISDLGVARILNLTPLQVSRMTQTPGTPAYMPPEVMIGDPKYDASIDVFSYGVLMIHVLSGRWPEPRIGQTRVDSSTRNLMPVTEAERREVYLRDIGYNHPLMDFILRCIDNDARCRAHANEIVVRLAVMVQQFPPSLCNRLEMLKCIEEKKQVVKEAEDKRRELLVKAKAVDQQNFVLCGEVEHLKLQIRNLNSEIQLLMAKNESRVSELERSDKLLKKLMNELAQLRTNYHVLEQQISTMKTRILRKGDALEKKDSEHNTTIAVLEQKCDVISGLSDQLTRAREYLSSKQQVRKITSGPL